MAKLTAQSILGEWHNDQSNIINMDSRKLAAFKAKTKRVINSSTNNNDIRNLTNILDTIDRVRNIKTPTVAKFGIDENGKIELDKEYQLVVIDYQSSYCGKILWRGDLGDHTTISVNVNGADTVYTVIQHDLNPWWYTFPTGCLTGPVTNLIDKYIDLDPDFHDMGKLLAVGDSSMERATKMIGCHYADSTPLLEKFSFVQFPK